jgi:hypothetical protein
MSKRQRVECFRASGVKPKTPRKPRAEWHEDKECLRRFVAPKAKVALPQSRRDGPIVAWHEVPGAAPSQKSRPVGYGVIGAGRRDSMIGVISLP